MGLLNNLFGSNKKTSTFQDADLGDLTILSHSGNNMVWRGHVKFLNENVSLFISGSSDQLHALEKKSVFGILKNEASMELEIDEALRTQYEEADKQYSKWRNHFNLISISTLNNEISISFEEKESLYHFNVYFLNGKQAGVSIDA
jgi:hypothetical protein